MPELRIAADDFQIGDRVHTDDGRRVEVRTIERSGLGDITVNRGAGDQLDGKVWQHATVTRAKQSKKSRPSLGTDCECGHTYNWHVPGGVCQVPECVCKKHVTRAG